MTVRALVLTAAGTGLAVSAVGLSRPVLESRPLSDEAVRQVPPVMTVSGRGRWTSGPDQRPGHKVLSFLVRGNGYRRLPRVLAMFTRNQPRVHHR